MQRIRAADRPNETRDSDSTCPHFELRAHVEKFARECKFERIRPRAQVTNGQRGAESAKQNGGINMPFCSSYFSFVDQPARSTTRILSVSKCSYRKRTSCSEFCVDVHDGEQRERQRI